MCSRRGWVCTIVLTVLATTIAVSQSARKVIRAARAVEAVRLDGVLDEAVWDREAFREFLQRDPNQGSAPSESTEVWIAYDDAALYVAARIHDSQPESINVRLGRRDDYIDTDYFTVFIDGYHDRQSGNYFTVSAAGVQYDGVMYNDDWDDSDWDGVWESETRVNGEGWFTEIRIPYSQLRFYDAEELVWGINFRRDIARKNERSYLVYTPRQESGFVSRFGDLVGLEDIHPPQRLSVLPYAITKAEYIPSPPGNPFHSGSRYSPGLGADLQAGFGSNLTLNATINPDFGQVEVDPAVINLSDVESFFQEKRPFFVEGSNTFQFGQGGSNSFWGFNWSSPNIFYSRRIGRNPQGQLPSNDFADPPSGTHILGAGKLTGKLDDVTNFGMVHAVTQREFTRIQAGGVRSDVEVEPLTYYGVMRAQRTFEDRRYGLGVISTYAHRYFDDMALSNQINKDALVSGIDGWLFLDTSKTYVVTAWMSGSLVSGTQARMTALQRSSSHYFQRPDAEHIEVNSSATSLSGYAMRWTLNRQKGPITLNAAFGVISPGYEINDMGFLFRTDYINGHVATGYVWTEPNSVYRDLGLRTSLFGSGDFAGNTTWKGWWNNGFVTWANYWFTEFGATYNPPTINNRKTRGGPLGVNPEGVEVFGGMGTDSRKAVVGQLFFFNYNGGGGRDWSFDPSVEFKPTPGLSISVGPSYSESISGSMWVGSYDDPTASETYGRRYVVSNFHQKTLSANIRMNWIFTPRLSLQLFLQPLISSGEYSTFKYMNRPKEYAYTYFGSNGSSVAEKDTLGNIRYTVDGDGAGPAPAYMFSNPDFNSRSIRGNAVLRWEYRPGSTFYFVWTQSRSDFEPNGSFQFRRSINRLSSVKPDNIFLIKFSYWWSV